MTTISVIIICKNEAINIVECIQSASFADEVLVLDSGSEDNTISLARAEGAKVLELDWPGYGKQKNRAVDASSGEWIFSLDADERISEELAKEITYQINQNKITVFDVPRSSLYVSRFMKHSGWSPDRTRRLFKRGHAKFTDSTVHEHLATNKPTGHLTQPLIHYSYRDLETVLHKINEYSSASAKQISIQSKKQGSLRKAIFHGLWAFFRTYIIRAGLLDGREGFMLAISNAEGVYYRYIKLMYLQQKNDSQ